MDNGILFKYQIPAILFKAALQPIGRLGVRLGSLEIAKTSVDLFGATSFYLPLEIHNKIVNREYAVRTLHYHPDEGGDDDQCPKTTQIVCLSIVRAPRAA